MDLDMEKGLALLMQAKESLAGFLLKREQLVLAEKLFNLTITSYPELFELEYDVKVLEKIYSLYTEVKESIASWSTNLWINLDINVLNKGVEV